MQRLPALVGDKPLVVAGSACNMALPPWVVWLALLLVSVSAVLGESWSTALEEDVDFPAYMEFLATHRRSHEETRRMNSYSPERFQIFKATLRDIAYRNAHDTATYGVNQFSDLTAWFTRKEACLARPTGPSGRGAIPPK